MQRKQVEIEERSDNTSSRQENSLLDGEFDEKGGHESFEEARNLWLKHNKSEGLLDSQPVLQSMWNLTVAQSGKNCMDSFEPETQNSSVFSFRRSCYNCFKLYLSDTGVLDTFSLKHFCSTLCLDTFVFTSKVSCKNCKKCFKRNECIFVEDQADFFCSLVCVEFNRVPLDCSLTQNEITITQPIVEKADD